MEKDADSILHIPHGKALKMLRRRGYEVAVTRNQDSAAWYAKKKGVILSADSPLALFGLSEIYRVRGANWNSRNDIDIYLPD